MNAQKKGISVRFTPEEIGKLETLSERYMVPMTTIIRWAIHALSDYTEKTEGKVTLPIDFTSLVTTSRKEARTQATRSHRDPSLNESHRYNQSED